MNKDFFEDIEDRIQDGENLDDLFEDIIDQLGSKKFRGDVKRDFEPYFRRLSRNPNRIYRFEENVADLVDKGFQELGTSSDNFKEYLSEALDENEELGDELENFIFSWRFFLLLIYLYQQEPSPKYRRPITNLFRGAYEENSDEVEDVLDKQIQWRKILYGYKKAMSRTGTREVPKRQILVNKIEIIENLFGSVYLPVMSFVGKLISVQAGYSTKVDTSNIEQRLETSNLSKSRFWDDEVRHIRNSSAHNTYDVSHEKVLLIDRDWEKEYSGEELDNKISQIVEVSKNTFYALSVGYGANALEYDFHS